MLGPLRKCLDRILTSGSLTLIDATGCDYHFGDGNGPAITARITDRHTEWRLLANPTLALGEAYMDGRVVMERGTVYDLLEVVLSNLEGKPWPAWASALLQARVLTRRLRQYNPAPRAKKNVAHHYDLDSGLYELFLDDDRQYSCAYFEEPDLTLEDAQLAKKRHLAAKLDLRDGMTVLDIGCGWGGLALYLAKTTHVDVTGITLSEQQLKVSCERAAAEGLSRAVNFELVDYRKLEGRFDRIVSVGMFEHVGVNHDLDFFDRVRDLLKPDGVAVVHSIGRFDGPTATNPFIAKYIFPGGYIPALSEVFPAVEEKGLLVTDVEILRLHYAMTLRHWRRRFRGAWHTAVERYGERFCRMWEFYLAGSEIGFRYENLMVFQLQLAREQMALPLTRDYVFEAERELRARQSGSRRMKAQR